VRENELITEPGAYYVEARLDTGASAATWHGLYPAGQDGTEVAGGFVAVDIGEDGRVTISTPVDD